MCYEAIYRLFLSEPCAICSLNKFILAESVFDHLETIFFFSISSLHTHTHTHEYHKYFSPPYDLNADWTLLAYLLESFLSSAGNFFFFLSVVCGCYGSYS